MNQMIWLLAGILFVGIELSLSLLFHGCPFDQPVDILSMFALGISMSLFMGAVFFPLFYAGGAERGEVFLIIAILCAFGLDFTIVSITNELLDAGADTVVLGAIILAGCSLLVFALSYPLTVWIFRKMED